MRRTARGKKKEQTVCSRWYYGRPTVDAPGSTIAHSGVCTVVCRGANCCCRQGHLTRVLYEPAVRKIPKGKQRRSGPLELLYWSIRSSQHDLRRSNFARASGTLEPFTASTCPLCSVQAVRSAIGSAPQINPREVMMGKPFHAWFLAF